MGLTLPSVTELNEFKDGLEDTEALQKAADLLTLATGLTATPTDPLEARLVRSAILSMAWALDVRHEDQEAIFSPFSSEHIGSYSYSKAQKAVSEGEKTGVEDFDIAVEYFLRAQGLGAAFTSSEHVFKKGYQEQQGWLRSHDPSYWAG